MPDQPSDRKGPPRPPRKGKPATPRPPRSRDEDTPARPPRPPRQRDEAAGPRPPRAEQSKRRPAKEGGQPRPSSRSTQRPPRVTDRFAQEGALYLRHNHDPQWPAIQDAARRSLVLMSRLLLESLDAAGWRVIGNRRTEGQEYTFGFDNIWTLRHIASGRTVDLSPEQSYRDLLYVANPYEAAAEPELDRQAITRAALLEQKAALVARRAVAALDQQIKD